MVIPNKGLFVNKSICSNRPDTRFGYIVFHDAMMVIEHT